MNSKKRPRELIELDRKYGFWLKPIARLQIIVVIAKLKLKPGKSISTVEVIEKLRQKAAVSFVSFKVTESSLEYLKFEAELESIEKLDAVRDRLENTRLQLAVFDETVRVRTNRIKFGPMMQEWEEYFQQFNLESNELKPGYCPDTIHVRKLPLKWFGGSRPKTNILVDVFSNFGNVRRFHIPLLDELDTEMKKKDNDLERDDGGFKKFDFHSSGDLFDAFIMYNDYHSFVQAIEQLRGMKLVKQTNGSDKESLEYDILVNFDKTHHLSDRAIRKRQIAKKYGITSLEDLKEYKKRASEQKRKLNLRLEQLEKREKSAKNLLVYLLRKVDLEEQHRLKAEAAAERERMVKERLQAEEKRLREKLLERKRSFSHRYEDRYRDHRREYRGRVEEVTNSKRRLVSHDYSNVNSYRTNYHQEHQQHQHHHHHHHRQREKQEEIEDDGRIRERQNGKSSRLKSFIVRPVN